MPPKRGLEGRGKSPREHDRQRQHQDERHEEGRNTLADAAGHHQLVHDHHDRAVRQVQAVGRQAQVAHRPRVQQAQQRSRVAGGETGQQTPDGRAEREVDPEEVVDRPHRALPGDGRDHGRAAAASASHGHGRDPWDPLAPTMPAAMMPIANSAARSGAWLDQRDTRGGRRAGRWSPPSPRPA